MASSSSLSFASKLSFLRNGSYKNDAVGRNLLLDNSNLLKWNGKLSDPCFSKTRCLGVGVTRATATTEVVVDGDRVVKEDSRVLKVGLICGGPSAERGISLNSARSVLDHIQGDDLQVSCYYIDYDLNAFAISSAQVYSNTPADFDFKLASLAKGFSSLDEFAEHLAASVDIVFPVIHGRFGEDGGIQELLEKYNVPFIGTGSSECRKAFDKYDASLEMSKQGFITVPSFPVQGSETNESELSKWFTSNQLDPNSGKVVVKPARAGSSIGVTVAYGVSDSLRKANDLILEEGVKAQGIDDKVIVEIFLEGGSEFTAIVLDVGSGFDCHPVVLLPTEVELKFHGSVDVREKDGIFNYRRKYLPTQQSQKVLLSSQVAYHTPPRFPLNVIENIREGASILFRQLGLRDFARIDGWFLPNSTHAFSSKDGKFGRTGSGTVIYTDINLISGMEQTSFLFQQASKVGFSHSNILRSVIHRACLRFSNLASHNEVSVHLPRRSKSLQLDEAFNKREGIQKIFVLFGGDTSERQVSLMSGTNVWLNLQAFDDLDVTPCLLAPSDDHSDDSSRVVWSLPYSIVLRHTTEEVLDACIEAIEPARAALTSHLRNQVMNDLTEGLMKHSWFTGFDIADETPVRYSLEKWVKLAKEVQATSMEASVKMVHFSLYWSLKEFFIQVILVDTLAPEEFSCLGTRLFIPLLFSTKGPGVAASKTCMDKVATSLALSHLAELGVLTINKDVREREDLLNVPALEIWHELTSKLQCETLCVKPARDGCSTGVARLWLSHGMIEMPSPPPERLIFEPFIETDEIVVSSKSVGEQAQGLMWEGNSQWVEITVGVIGTYGAMHSLSPSVTVKETGGILSLEEKFQGGTGINLTPPPTSIVSNEALERCKQRIELIANTLQLEGFSRIDAFVNVDSGEVLIIEVNTVPGMTPSTVLIHQVGFSHSDILRSVIHQACLRFSTLASHNEVSVHLPRRSKSLQFDEAFNKREGIQNFFVLFGGDTSERQVSLMSGTNVWLNLQAFDDLDVTPCLLAPSNDHSDDSSRVVWSLPRIIHHPFIEEVLDACIEAIEPARAALTSHLRNQVMNDLTEGLMKHSWFTGFDIADETPVRYSLEKWIKLAKEVQATVFIAVLRHLFIQEYKQELTSDIVLVMLDNIGTYTHKQVHGGIGEDGTLQSLLESEGVLHTGPGVAASKTCMDKVATSLALSHLAELGVLTINKDVREREDLLNVPALEIWHELTSKLQCETLIDPKQEQLMFNCLSNETHLTESHFKKREESRTTICQLFFSSSGRQQTEPLPIIGLEQQKQHINIVLGQPTMRLTLSVMIAKTAVSSGSSSQNGGDIGDDGKDSSSGSS
ncbi:unnamed protein product [Dovyalis caffra]|uniref:ATP-grasp domain-containing protein n=1 Tax=Dovyalis caffra TaxID=77055 RepID=A0AAV1RMQ7_9ROSI|nr:unnamed protein product [Dovyalis caffra]